MPSIQDVADQINVKLDQINNNTAATVAVGNGIRADLGQVNARLDALDNHLQTGVAELSAGIFAVWELQKVTNTILDFHSQQHNTIICLIENTNELLCGITRKLTRQLDLSEQQLTALKRIEGIAERAHPAAAGDYDRLAALQGQIEACCPPPKPEPEPCPKPCDAPQPRPYRPKGQDWRPTPPPRPPQPIG